MAFTRLQICLPVSVVAACIFHSLGPRDIFHCFPVMMIYVIDISALMK